MISVLILAYWSPRIDSNVDFRLSIVGCWPSTMSRNGMYVEAEGYLKDVEVQARKDKAKAEVLFYACSKRSLGYTGVCNYS